MGKNDYDKTKRYNMKNQKLSSNKRNTKKPSKKDKKKHPKLRKTIKIGIIIFALLCLIGIGIFAGIFFSDKWKITQEDLAIAYHNTEIYDADGKQIAELTGEENRKIITMSEMGDYLPNAFVAIEDERFYSHYGIDIKRTSGAILSYITHGGKASFGGSTITQQLVKNMMDDDADEGIAGVERKIREWSRAYQIEKMLSKSQILELYLNKIFMGGTVYGVESAAHYYFNKSAKKLDLAEAAFIAGINHSPNSYNPFNKSLDNEEAIKTRTKTVLNQMKEMRNTKVKELEGLTKITDEEYDKAIAKVEKGLKFKKGSTGNSNNISFHTAAAIDQVAKELADEKDVNFDTARSMIFNGGYKIYTTQNKKIQKIMEEEYVKSKYIKSATTEKGRKEDQHSQSAMVIIEPKTGYVVGTVGGLGEDSSTIGLNRATQSYRQTGSSIKPLANIAPALEENIITAATVYDDSITRFGNNTFRNSTGYQGLCTVRKAIEVSSNIVNMKIISNLGPDKAVKFLNEIGLDKFDASDEMLTLALGGSTNGASTLQMAAAYAMIANGGEYITPTYYTKVESAAGRLILQAKQDKKRVMTEGNAYILANILNAPVTGSNGTARICKIPGIETGAKTGTTSDYKDKWLCGITPYYAAATWFGYDEPEQVNIYGMSNPAATLWSEIMKEVHSGLEEAEFEKPNNIVSATICMDSGKVATKQCSRTYKEVFVSGTVPSQCDGHEKVKICKDTKKLATEFCPKTTTKTYVSRPEKEVNPNWSTSEGGKYNEITETCTKHKEEEKEPEEPEETEPTPEETEPKPEETPTIDTPTNNNIVVPNVIGKTETQAKDELREFSIQVVFGKDTTKPNGVVLKQSLSAGQSVVKGAKITLTINDIPVVTEPPEEPTKNEEVPKENTEVEDKNEIT